MEGKALLFKRFADLDAIDLELATEDPEQLRAGGPAARAELRRHQPGRHQSAGMLRHRGAAAARDAHPGLPRRPARHGDHLRRGAAQRAGAGRARSSRTSGSSSAARARRRLPAPRFYRCWARGARTSCSATAWAWSTRAATADMNAVQGRVRRATRRAARWPRRWSAPTCSSASPRAVSSRRRWCARWPESPIIFALANPDPEIGYEEAKAARARRHRRDRPLRLSQPGQQRARLPVPVPRRAGCPRHADQRGDEDRRRAARWPRWRRRTCPTAVAKAYGLAGAALRAGLPDPQAARPARAAVGGARRGAGGDGDRRGAGAASTWTHTASSWKRGWASRAR